MSMIRVNLLPPEMRRSSGGFRFSKSVLLGGVGALAFVALLVGLSTLQSMRLSSVENDIARAQAQVDRLQDDIRLVDRLEDVKTKILRRMSAIETLDRGRGNWVSNIEDILAVMPNHLWLSGFYKDERGAAADTMQVKPQYIFDGFCFTISSLANLITNLQDSPRFSHIALNRAMLQELENRRVYGFQVVCELEDLSTMTTGYGDEPIEPEKLGSRGDVGDGTLSADVQWNELQPIGSN